MESSSSPPFASPEDVHLRRCSAHSWGGHSHRLLNSFYQFHMVTKVIISVSMRPDLMLVTITNEEAQADRRKRDRNG